MWRTVIVLTPNPLHQNTSLRTRQLLELKRIRRRANHWRVNPLSLALVGNMFSPEMLCFLDVMECLLEFSAWLQPIRSCLFVYICSSL